MKLSDIRLRDPFVFADPESKTYYLYGTSDTDPWFGKGEGFRVWNSTDLENWYGGNFAFVPPENFWSKQNYWAPEVHFYCGEYYMLATFGSSDGWRGVQILKSEALTGPFVPITDLPVTPGDWACLDGTLWIENDKPWLIFSHEWTQIHDGAICCMELSKDLKTAIGSPSVLFHASEAPWSVEGTGDVITMEGHNYVTDGPFLFKDDGKLKMLWSSYSAQGYAMGIAVSKSGRIIGPWEHAANPIYGKDGGHGMTFTTFDGKRKLAIHSPNTTPNERPVFLNIDVSQL